MAAQTKQAGNGSAPPVPTPRLKVRYADEIAPALRKEFAYRNVMQVPGLVKIVVNMGVGEAARDAKLIEGAVRDLTVITGQKPAIARAKKSIAKAKRTPKFKVRGYTRCSRCGRPRAVYRRFGLCRICFRDMAHRGELPGITKSSW